MTCWLVLRCGSAMKCDDLFYLLWISSFAQCCAKLFVEMNLYGVFFYQQCRCSLCLFEEGEEMRNIFILSCLRFFWPLSWFNIPDFNDWACVWARRSKYCRMLLEADRFANGIQCHTKFATSAESGHTWQNSARPWACWERSNSKVSYNLSFQK